jgi:hypothetical protein
VIKCLRTVHWLLLTIYFLLLTACRLLPAAHLYSPENLSPANVLEIGFFGFPAKKNCQHGTKLNFFHP